MIFESSVLYDYKGFEAPETVGFEDAHVVSTVNVDKVITQPHNNESCLWDDQYVVCSQAYQYICSTKN